jgi:tetratricopeptide (TPR) repeat protein
VFEQAVKDFEDATCERAEADPTDLHYLAVLYHKQKKFTEAKECYEAAQKRYEALCKAGADSYRSMWALCLLDHGVLEYNHLRTNQFQAAVGLFRDARLLFKDRSPPKPFEMFALCREADAQRKQGRFGMCNLRFEDALEVAREWDPERTHLLTAAAHKHRAWSYMETWDIQPAMEQFRRAQSILEKPDNRSRDETIIDRLHARHGLAMAERFQGRPGEALRQYRGLTQAIAQEIRKLDNRCSDVRNYTELRHLLYDRLVNSLERQGLPAVRAGRPRRGSR